MIYIKKLLIYTSLTIFNVYTIHGSTKTLTDTSKLLQLLKKVNQLKQYNAQTIPIKTQKITKILPEKTSTSPKGWTLVSEEQKEYDSIKNEIETIKHWFVNLGTSPYLTAAYPREVFALLKKKGTPIAYKILEELIESGDIPKSYLQKS